MTGVFCIKETIMTKKNKNFQILSSLLPPGVTIEDRLPDFFDYLKSIGKEKLSPQKAADYLEDYIKLSHDSLPKIENVDEFNNFDFLYNTTDDPSTAVIKMYAKTLTPAKAKTSDDYLALSTIAPSLTTRLRYLHKALKLDPLNFDVTIELISLKELSLDELVNEYGKAYNNAKDLLTKHGYMSKERLGNYGHIIKTYPFLRLLYEYVSALVNTNRLITAIDIIKEALYFSANIDLSFQQDLMHLYVKLQRFDEALALQTKYKKTASISMLLPLSILYYTTRNYTKARNTLKKFANSKEFFDVFVTINSHGLTKAMKDIFTVPLSLYERNSTEELFVTLEKYPYLYRDCESYFTWAYEELKKIHL